MKKAAGALSEERKGGGGTSARALSVSVWNSAPSLTGVAI